MVDPLIEAASNNRWQAEAGEPLDDRPGLVASLLRYRWILVTATLLGAVAGYGISQRASVRYQANAVLILADPGGPSVLGGATSLGSTDRQVYLARQADIMTTSDVLERALELLGSRQSPLDVRRQLDLVGRFFAERLSARTADRVSIWASQKAVDAALRAAGLGHVEFMLGDEEPPVLLEGNFHHLGATRMHTDPAMGVVDADCRVHGVSNLYVAGSSVFPTYGCSNPTLTLVALALRLADHLKKRLAA